jgi:peptidoglycan hydrolase-like protein with peptidoglycan-binding domain
LKRTIAVFAALAVTLAGVFFAAAPAQAAVPNCNDWTPRDTPMLYPDNSGDFIMARLPSYGLTNTKCGLYQGSYGVAVEYLQNTLNDCFDLSQVLEEDGDFGPRTKAMLKEAQSKVGTTADGAYGPKTRDAFNKKSKWAAYYPGSGILFCSSVKYLPQDI